LENHQLAVGLIVDLNYSNPYMNPFAEFQRFKHHPAITPYLNGAERIAFGARAIAKGGIQSLPKQQFPGGLLIGCDAGTLNAGKLKGSHTAMKSGMLAAEAVVNKLKAIESEGSYKPCEADYHSLFESSWLYQELTQTSNFSPAILQHGTLLGGALNTLEHNLCRVMFTSPPPWQVKSPQADYVSLIAKDQCAPIDYLRPDGKISFDKPSSVFLSGTQHEEDQPNHLQLASDSIPIYNHLPMFDEPSQRYCPAGVYEVVEEQGMTKLQINPSNCLHCKTCDIKDPSQNITWTSPEGGGGPNYQNM
jgi:electron-transferring-flavoprotein dehydrogenase